MKKIVILSPVLLFAAMTLNAQPGKQRTKSNSTAPSTTTTQKIKQPAGNNWRDDSLLWIKDPKNPAVKTNTNSTNAASSQKANTPPGPLREDSILFIKNPKNQPVRTNTNSNTPASNRTTNTKLDDLKNPFDTTKRVQRVQ